MSHRVRLPAIGLICSSALAVLSELALLVFAALGGSGQLGSKPGREDLAVGIVLGLIALFGVLIHAAAIWGAVRMLSLRSWAFSVVAAVLVALPCSAGCVPGIPFGIWAIVVLLDEEVKASFS